MANNTPHNLYFLQGGGETGQIIRSTDWSGTSLGAVTDWPATYKTAVSLMLNAPLATNLFLGKDLVLLYNDRLIPILGNTRHPSSFGFPAKQVSQAWDIVAPLFAKVLSGESVFIKDAKLFLDKNGYTEECYFDISYSPIYVEDGTIGGIQGVIIETTDKVTTLQDLRESGIKLRQMVQQAPVATALFIGEAMVIELANDIIIRYWGKGDAIIGKPISEVLPELNGQPFFQYLDKVFTTGITIQEKGASADIMKDGVLTRLYFDYSFTAMQNAAKEIYGIMVTAVDVTEQIAARQKLEKSQQELLSYFEDSPIAIAVLDKQLTFRMANKFYAEFVGRKREDILNKPILQVLPEIAGQDFEVALNEVIRTGVPFLADESPVELLRNGVLEKLYINLTYQPRFAGTEIIGVLVVAVDITQQILARKIVEENELKFRTLIADAPMATCLFTGSNHVIELANDIMIGFWGKGNSVLGKPLLEALPELKGQPFIQLLDEVFTTGVSYEAKAAEAKLEVNGILGTYYFNFTYKALRNTAGEIYGIMDMAIDVTEQVLASRALEESKDQLQFAIDAAELGTWDLNPHTGKFTGNERLKNLFGLHANDDIPLNLATDVIAIHDRQRVLADIQNALIPANGGRYDTEYTIVHPITNKETIVKAKGKVWFDENNDAYRFNGTLQDITRETIAKETERAKIEKVVKERTRELAEANNNLQRSNAELEQFAYIASHDLQEPVRKISTFAELLETNLGEGNKLTKHYLDRIHSSADRMTTLIRGVLAYSQVNSDKEEFQSTDLNTIIEDIRVDFDLLIEQRGAIVKVERLPMVNAIPIHMTQLFSNLLSNSLKYTRTGISPVISVSVLPVSAGEVTAHQLPATPDNYFKIRFADNGIGFKEEHAERIFNIFQRLHGKTAFEGTGIGLSVCRKIVQNHHGAINAAGSEEGSAVFNIILPFQK